MKFFDLSSGEGKEMNMSINKALARGLSIISLREEEVPENVKFIFCIGDEVIGKLNGATGISFHVLGKECGLSGGDNYLVRKSADGSSCRLSKQILENQFSYVENPSSDVEALLKTPPDCFPDTPKKTFRFSENPDC